MLVLRQKWILLYFRILPRAHFSCTFHLQPYRWMCISSTIWGRLLITRIMLRISSVFLWLTNPPGYILRGSVLMKASKAYDSFDDNRGIRRHEFLNYFSRIIQG